MPIWKDALYFDSPSKDVDNGEPKFAADDQKQIEDGPDNENDEKDKYEDDSSPKEVNTAGQHVNTASPKVNTGRFKLNTVDPSVNTASSYDQDSPKDICTDLPELYQVQMDFAIKYGKEFVAAATELMPEHGVSRQDELERGDVPKSVQCYMHESGASEVESKAYIKKLTLETWKKLNKERQTIHFKFSQELIDNQLHKQMKMSATRQGMSFAEIEQIVAQRVVNAIEFIVVYETRIRMAHDSMDQVVRQDANVSRNANNKRKLHHAGPCKVKATTVRELDTRQRDVELPSLQQLRGPCNSLSFINYFVVTL
ncbi:ribonuclease H-like domain-containing protein [Tanacetum coccineum]